MRDYFEKFCRKAFIVSNQIFLFCGNALYALKAKLLSIVDLRSAFHSFQFWVEIIDYYSFSIEHSVRQSSASAGLHHFFLASARPMHNSSDVITLCVDNMAARQWRPSILTTESSVSLCDLR